MIPFPFQSGGLGRFGIRSASALWNPSNLSLPPTVWLDDTTGVTDAGSGACSSWDNRDFASTAINFAQGTGGNRPTIVASVLNSLRIIRFDGSNDHLSCSDSPVPGLFQNVSFGYIFMVWQRAVSSGGGASRVLTGYCSQTAGNARFQMLCDSAANANKLSFQTRKDAEAAVTLAGATNVNSGWHMGLVYMNWGTREGRVYVDGTLDGQNTTLTASAGTTNASAAASNANIATSISLTANADIDVAAKFAGSGSSALTDAEIDKLFGQQAHYWGLTSLLPALHPYKLAPPTV